VYEADWSRRISALFMESRRRAWTEVPPNVWALGWTSFLTDISSEMVTAILPMYLIVHLGLSPLSFGAVDGLYQGTTVLTRWLGGLVGDRSRQYKYVAGAGYLISALSRIGWLLTSGGAALAAGMVAIDRIGKGVRTAPRDALIALSSRPDRLATSFGVHRALDAAGATLGPLAAFAVLFAVPSGYDLVFVISACVAVLGLGVLALFVINAVPPALEPLPASPVPPPLRRLLGNRRFVTLVLIGAGLAAATVSDAFVYLALQRDQIEPLSLPLLYTSTSMVFLAMAAPAGYVADRAGASRVFLGGHVLLLLAYASASLAMKPAGFVLVPLLLGTYYAATDGVLAAMGSAVLPAELRGRGLAVLGTGTSLARLSSSVVFGFVWVQGTASLAMSAFAAALVCMLAVAAAALGGFSR
jgi:MFS family permease